MVLLLNYKIYVFKMTIGLEYYKMSCHVYRLLDNSNYNKIYYIYLNY